MRSIEWKDGEIVVVDQAVLPHRLEHLRLRSTDEIVEAIELMRVRGAPALGIIAAYGVAQAGLRTISSSARSVFEAADYAGRKIVETRPTAVNMSWAVARALGAARPLVASAGPQRVRRALIDEAIAIQAEDEAACEAMAKHALEFFTPEGVVLTHCNTGSLVTGGIGTALGAIRRAHEQGIGLAVIATETRPLLQGSRLTAWELGRLGIPHALVVDSAAPSLIARGEVSLVLVGADRIAANGDTANKVGTYPLALAAAAAGVPFIVVAPTSTVDLDTPTGAQIEVEERNAREVTTIMGTVESAPYGTAAINPVFDVTPADFISAIVTERGVAEGPYEQSLRSVVGAKGKAKPKPKPTKPATAVASQKPTAKKKQAEPSRSTTRSRASGKKTAAKKTPAKKTPATKKTTKSARPKPKKR